MLSLIVCFDKNQVIGKDNAMPWHYPEDLKYFKKTTLGHKVVMGRNTFQSILDCLGKPFPGRDNIVITDEEFNYEADNLKYYNNLDYIIDNYKDCDEEVFIAGGMSIYNQMIDHCDKLYITHINKEFNGDAFFPEFDYTLFEKTFSNTVEDLEFCIYERKTNA